MTTFNPQDTKQHIVKLYEATQQLWNTINLSARQDHSYKQ